MLEKISEGQIITDVLSQAPDADYVLHPDEISDLEWRMADLPLTALFPPEKLNDKVRLDGETVIEASRRWRSVRRWMEKAGGPAEALAQSPIIAVVRDGEIEVLDGWHRCVVSFQDYGVDTVRVAVGTEPGLFPAQERPCDL